MQDSDTLARMLDDGWSVITDEGFVGLVGPFVQKGSWPDLQFGFITDGRHRNLRGVVQGGALMTFADRILGMTARACTKAERTATVQMDVHFIDAVEIGDFVEARPAVIRATRQLVFMTGQLMVGERIVATANGIWKQLAPRPNAPSA